MDGFTAIPANPPRPANPTALQLLILPLPLQAPGRRPGTNPRTRRIMAA